MSSKANDAVWDVIIENEGTSSKSVLSLSTSLSLDEVLQRWITECSLSDDFSHGFFRTQEGTRLHRDQRLRDVGDRRLGIAKLLFTPGQAQYWDVIVCRADASAKRMYSFPVSSPLAHVFARWREDAEESGEGSFFSQGHVRLRAEQTVGEIGDSALQMVKIVFELRVTPSCDVIVTEGNVRRHFTLPVSSSARQLFARWSEEGGAASGVFLTPDGTAVAMEERLEDIHALNPDLHVLRLLFERSVPMRLELDGETRVVELRLSQTPDDVWPIIREAFGLAEDRDFRLQAGVGLLDRRRPFSKQTATTALTVELGVDLRFVHAWEQLSVEIEAVFPSDDCAEVVRDVLDALRAARKAAAADPQPPQSSEPQPEPELDALPWLREAMRLLEIAYADSDNSSDSEDDVADFSVLAGRWPFTGRVGTALAAAGAPRRRRFDLRLDQRRSVFVLDGCRVRELSASPLLTAAEVCGGGVSFEGRVATGAQPLADLRLPDGGLLVLRPLSLHLRLTCGRRTDVLLPAVATVGDLRRVAEACERQGGVRLRCGERRLEADDCALADAGLRSGDVVEVERGRLRMSVDVGGRRVAWWSARDAVSLREVRERSLAAELRCAGCERRLTADSRIPVHCCHIASTQLTDARHDTEKEAAAEKLSKEMTLLQLTVKKLLEEKEDLERNNQQLLREQAESGDRFQRLFKEKKEIEDWHDEKEELQQENQKLTKLKNSVSKENEKLKRANADLLKEKDKFVIEIADLSAEKDRLKTMNNDLRKENKRLKSWNGILGDVNDKSSADRLFFIQKATSGDIPRAKLFLPPAPTIAEVRGQIAFLIGWRVEETQMGRRMGLVDGRRVFWADADRTSDFFFADSTGKVYPDSEVKEWDREDLRDDADHFPLIAGFVNVVRVARRRR